MDISDLCACVCVCVCVCVTDSAETPPSVGYGSSIGSANLTDENSLDDCIDSDVLNVTHWQHSLYQLMTCWCCSCCCTISPLRWVSCTNRRVTSVVITNFYQCAVHVIEMKLKVNWSERVRQVLSNDTLWGSPALYPPSIRVLVVHLPFIFTSFRLTEVALSASLTFDLLTVYSNAAARQASRTTFDLLTSRWWHMTRSSSLTFFHFQLRHRHAKHIRRLCVDHSSIELPCVLVLCFYCREGGPRKGLVRNFGC